MKLKRVMPSSTSKGVDKTGRLVVILLNRTLCILFAPLYQKFLCGFFKPCTKEEVDIFFKRNIFNDSSDKRSRAGRKTVTGVFSTICNFLAVNVRDEGLQFFFRPLVAALA